MKYFNFFFFTFLTLSSVYLFNNKIPVGERPIPPLAKILNPFKGLWQNGEGYQFNNQEFKHPILKESVRIVYDDRKVPHIYAQNLEDALFAQGYVEAADRLFQMDFSTRAAAGRLSEVLGKRMVEYDKERRRFGLAFGAENAVASWQKQKDLYPFLETYCDGINAYIDQLKPKDYPIEHKLIGMKPEKWSTYKSALFFKSMAEVLCSREYDVRASNSLKHFGRETFDFLYPEINENESPIIPAGTIWDFKSDEGESKSVLSDELSFIEDIRTSRSPEGVGSNNWVLSGDKTQTGYPILCNDPHLSLSLPSIWFEVHIHTPDFNAYGVSLPGMPGIMIGFNDDIAWGETNVGHDVMDWIELEWTDETKTSYNYDGQPKSIEYKIEEIKTKEGALFLDTVAYSVWGPLAYSGIHNDYENLAMRWLAHRGSEKPEFLTFVNLMQCSNYEEFEKAIEVFDTPAQNFAFAAEDGDIALHVNGLLPKKGHENGRFVQKGIGSQTNWDEFIPRKENPKILNPERGYVSSANQRSADIDYPYYYTGSFEDYRGRMVNRLLDSLQGATVDDMQVLHWNSFNIKAEEFLPLFLEALNENLREANAELYKDLKSWDYSNTQESTAASFFEIWYRKFYRMVWDEIYSNDSKVSLLLPESWRLLEILESNPEHDFFDIKSSTEKEIAKDIILMSFEESLDKIKEYDNLPLAPEWGDYRKVSIWHHLEVPAFSALNIRTDGHPSTINATNYGFGPSWRMIVQLGESVEALGVLPGGQSGNPSSPFYWNGLEKWSKGEYFPLNAADSPEKIEDVLFEIKIEANE